MKGVEDRSYKEVFFECKAFTDFGQNVYEVGGF